MKKQEAHAPFRGWVVHEISEDIYVNGQDRDFYEICFMKEEIKTLLNCLKGLKTE